MMKSLGLTDREEPTAELSFDRTVGRGMVHRTALSEVFVTDMRSIDESHYLAGAQLPLAHSYYSDHRLALRRFDPLLLLEAARQAAVYGAHRYLDVSLRTAFLVNTLSMSCDDPGGLAVGPLPGELRIATSYPTVQRRHDRVRSVAVAQRLHLGGSPIGTVAMEVTAMTPKEHSALRYLQRRDAPPSTGDADFTAASGAAASVAPALVARENPGNVMLAEPVHSDGVLRAALSPKLDNSSLFDHSYDHLPAMVLLECARQLALIAVDDGTGEVARQTAVSGCSASFLRFVELDEPVTATTPELRDAAASGPLTVPVSFTQAGATVAETTVTLAPATRRQTR